MEFMAYRCSEVLGFNAGGGGVGKFMGQGLGFGFRFQGSGFRDLGFGMLQALVGWTRS